MLMLAAHLWSATPVSLKSSDARLVKAFVWARQQALAYAFQGDPVGDWYEAALPGRQAFCMRDTAHQCAGAHFLGLDDQTHNMLRKFAENISDSKDWCSYWEIDRHNRPAPVDYEDDTRFWYNLPANFDILDACYRMYVWSGDSTYITDSVFQNFYRRTVHDYVDRWDLSVDRIMERPRIMNVRGHIDPDNRFQRDRGIPSYDEANPEFTVAIDQLAAEYAGYLAYARIAQFKGETGEAKEFLSRAEAMRSLVNSVWWDNKSNSYYSRVNRKHQLEGHGLDSSLLYYDVAAPGKKSSAVVNSIMKAIGREQPPVELESHLPEILYHYGEPGAAYKEVLDLTSKSKDRREYPEVSYSVIGAVVQGLMGIEVEVADPAKTPQDAAYVEGSIVTIPRLTSETQWAEVDHVSVGANEIRVRHDGITRSTLENSGGPSLIWKACFPGAFKTLAVDARPVLAQHEEANGQEISCASVVVGSHDSRTVESLSGSAPAISPVPLR